MGKKGLMPEEVSEIHSDLDHDAVEAAALSVTEFDEQVVCAYAEIKTQIAKMNL